MRDENIIAASFLLAILLIFCTYYFVSFVLSCLSACLFVSWCNFVSFIRLVFLPRFLVSFYRVVLIMFSFCVLLISCSSAYLSLYLLKQIAFDRTNEMNNYGIQ